MSDGKITDELRQICGDLEDMSVWKDTVDISEVRTRLEAAVGNLERAIADPAPTAEYARGRRDGLRDAERETRIICTRYTDSRDVQTSCEHSLAIQRLIDAAEKERGT
ncbi:MAG: hypothetical protein ACKV2Q_36670 [Planctomycetaceae bacterium]